MLARSRVCWRRRAALVPWAGGAARLYRVNQSLPKNRKRRCRLNVYDRITKGAEFIGASDIHPS